MAAIYQNIFHVPFYVCCQQNGSLYVSAIPDDEHWKSWSIK
jgi:hypothetical protein